MARNCCVFVFAWDLPFGFIDIGKRGEEEEGEERALRTVSGVTAVVILAGCSRLLFVALGREKRGDPDQTHVQQQRIYTYTREGEGRVLLL